MKLITGGNGFIGSNLVHWYNTQKEKPIVIDIANFDATTNQCEPYNIDIYKKKELEHVFKSNKIETVYHMAANTKIPISIKNPSLDMRTNIVGTFNLLELSRKYDVKKFIFSSSSSIYGWSNNTNENETSPYPETPYGVSKLTGEHYCAVYSKLYGLKTLSLRYFNVYGPGQRAGVIKNFLERAKTNKALQINGDGSFVRDFVHVSDIILANTLAEKCNLNYGEVNVGTGVGTTIFHLATIFKSLNLKCKIMRSQKERKGDIPTSIAYTKNAEEILGFKSTVTIEQGIKSLWKEYTERR